MIIPISAPIWSRERPNIPPVIENIISKNISSLFPERKSPKKKSNDMQPRPMNPRYPWGRENRVPNLRSHTMIAVVRIMYNKGRGKSFHRSRTTGLS
jgi:hypothetical protein